MSLSAARASQPCPWPQHERELAGLAGLQTTMHFTPSPILQCCIVLASLCQVGGLQPPSLSGSSRGRARTVLAAARPPKRTEVVVSAEVAPATTPASGTAVQLALCCAIGSFCSLDRVVMGVAIIPMAADLGFSETTKGLIAAASRSGTA